jgi:phospholipase/carboxylesterase
MRLPTLDAIVVEPKSPANRSVILLHGLGADGHDFVDIIPQLQLADNLATRFIFPHAPLRQVTINGGMQMRAWYDILGLSINSKQDEAGIINANHAVSDLIDQEIANGIPARHIVLAGFSQGGALALYSGLRYPHKLAGILALSTYLPSTSQQPINKTTTQHVPIFMAHGALDPIVTLTLGEASRQHLQQLGLTVDWHTYPMAHTVCPQEVQDISTWLNHVFKAT